MKLRLLLAVPGLLLLSQTADAHLKVTSHLSRYGDSQIKTGPCGVANGVRTTDKIYIAKPGTQVTLVWDEYVNHPGFYKIDFDLDGDDDFSDPILACAAPQTSIADCFDTTNTGPYMVNNILDEAAAVQSYVYTLPDVECGNCTLQVVQAMQDKPPFTSPGNEMYYQCIDIILDNNGPDVLTLVAPGDLPDAGAVNPGDPDAAAVVPGGPDAGDQVNPQAPVDGGCGCQSTGTQSGLMLTLLGMFWIFRQRRRHN